MSAYAQPKFPKSAFVDSLGLRPWVIAATFVSIVVLLIFGIFELTVQLSRVAGRSICSNFQSQTGFKTKFVVLYWADSGTCLAQAPDGRWVLNTKITQFVGQRP